MKQRLVALLRSALGNLRDLCEILLRLLVPRCPKCDGILYRIGDSTDTLSSSSMSQNEVLFCGNCGYTTELPQPLKQ